MLAKKRVAAALCAPATGAGVRVLTRGRVPSRGRRFDTVSPAVSDTTRAQLFFGLYEGAEIRMAKRHLRDTACLIDLGCSIGVLAAFAGERVVARGQIFGVEANPGLIELARANIARNVPHVEAQVVHGAIDYSHEPGSTAQFLKTFDHTASALAADGGSDVAFTAPVVRLSDIVSTANIDRFTLLADIEGAEAGLLIDDAPSLSRCDQVLIELHETRYSGRVYTADELLDLALALGFVVEASYGNVYVLNRP